MLNYTVIQRTGKAEIISGAPASPIRPQMFAVV